MKKKTNKSTATREQKIIRWMWIICISPLALILFLLALTAIGTFGRMPSFEELENPKSNLATEIYADNGKVIGSFFVQNRSYVQYADLFPQDSTALLQLSGRTVPPVAAALIATEDARFYSHSGIDLQSLMRVGVKTIMLGRSSQGGGSTITH
ncbi:MAG: transglycosylase domain-containing protein [Alistipes sp.]|nr:transglycosylase domain-containing protein [Alistipes sp.]